MFADIFRNVINECFNNLLNEGDWFKQSTHPEPRTHDDHHNGSHSPVDSVVQPSTEDWEGAKFNGEHIIVSPNKFIIYKIKNFANPDLKGSMSFFNNTKDLRKAIDTVNGGAKRNGRSVLWRTITSQEFEKIARRNDFMSYTFWEFSLNGGSTWLILKPSPLQTPKESKFVKS